MDDLRIALLIAGIVVVIVVAIYTYARHSRRRAAREMEELELGALDSREDWEIVSIDRMSPEPGPTRETPDIAPDVDELGRMFAPNREISDAESSVDLNILAGLRATYESTIDSTVDESIAPEPSEDSAAAGSGPGVDADQRPVAARVESSGAGSPGVESPLAVDMTRPLFYLTLVAKQGRVAGREVRESLEAEGFRPGLMGLYYWRNDAESSVVFGVANMVEPGLLDPDALLRMETPGLVTFMSVPQDAAIAFRTLNAMVAVSRRLARKIDATLCDETRSTFTAQAENHLREKIADTLRQDRIRD
ncbi:MAG: hypothetical protein OXC65_04310 [Thiotrichales bacterium]|nr:hypothetical protein [Thiotrichales bacterium]